MSSDEEVTNQNFTGFDAQPIARPSRVAAVGGGSATDKHRENRAHAQGLNVNSGMKASGIVDASSTGGAQLSVDGTHAGGGGGIPGTGDLGSFGAHGKKATKRHHNGHQGPTSSSVPSLQSSEQHLAGVGGGGGMTATQLNAKDSEDIERKMRSEMAKATGQQGGGAKQEDVFEAEYAALQTTYQQQPQQAAPPAVTDVADDDFDF